MIVWDNTRLISCCIYIAVFIAIFIQKGTKASKCQIDNIKRGYALKHGLNQDNVKSLGQADNLELCNELCCRNETFSVGLFDGIKCYGIKCIGDKDRRCNLLRDGNADYTIFKILRPFFQRSDQIAVKKKKKRRRRKRRKNIRKQARPSQMTQVKEGYIKKLKQKIKTYNSTNSNNITRYHQKRHIRNSHKRKKNSTRYFTPENIRNNNVTANKVTFSLAGTKTILTLPHNVTFSFQNTSSSIQHSTKNKPQLHRKHKKRRKTRHNKHSKKYHKERTSKHRYSRDYPFLYNNHPNDELGVAYAKLLKDSASDRALMDKLLTEQAQENSLSSKRTIGSTTSFQPVLDVNSIDTNQGDIGSIVSPRSNIYDQSLLTPLYPQQQNVDLLSTMQKNMITNLPSQVNSLTSVNVASKGLINPNTYLGGYTQQISNLNSFALPNPTPATVPIVDRKSTVNRIPNPQSFTNIPLKNVAQNLTIVAPVKKSAQMSKPVLVTSTIQTPLTTTITNAVKENKFPILPYKVVPHLQPMNPVNNNNNNIQQRNSVYPGKPAAVLQQRNVLQATTTKMSQQNSIEMTPKINRNTVLQKSFVHTPAINIPQPKKSNTQKKTLLLPQKSVIPAVKPVKAIEKTIKADIQPLKEFSTDKDFRFMDEKDEIPHPEELEPTQENVIATKDSLVDVPFPAHIQLPKSESLTRGLLNYPQSVVQQYVTDNAQQRRTSHIQSHPNDATRNFYSLMYPFSTIQRKTYQNMILESKEPVEYFSSMVDEPKDSDIEIIDVSKADSNREKQGQLRYLNTYVPIAESSSYDKISTPKQNQSTLKESQFTDKNSTNDFQNETDSKLVVKPSPEDVKKAIHEIVELKTQVESLLEEHNSTNQSSQATTPTNSTSPGIKASNSSLINNILESFAANLSAVNLSAANQSKSSFSKDMETLLHLNMNNSTNNSNPQDHTSPDKSKNVSTQPTLIFKNKSNSNLTTIPLKNEKKNSKMVANNVSSVSTSNSFAYTPNNTFIVENSGCMSPIGISDSSIIKDDRMKASSSMDNFAPSRGRLRIKEKGEGYAGSWCADVNKTLAGKQPFLQIDIGNRHMFCRIATQGDISMRSWVKRFKLQFSDDERHWEPYREDGKEKIFVGNEDGLDTTYKTLKNPILSRFVRFIPISWSGITPCMRVELFNTSLNQFLKEKPQSRSEIPKGHVGLIDDLDFEKMDGAVSLDRSSFGNNGFLAGGAKLYDSHSSCRHAVKIPPGGDIVIDGSIMKVRPREAITIAAWVQLNKVEGVHSLFDTVGEHSKHDLGQFHFEIVGGDVRWFHRNETEDIIFNVITEKKLIKPNEWNHIAATYDSVTGDAIILVNGTERVKEKGHGLISKDWDQRVGIGRHKGVRFLNGQIDNFKIYDKALGISEIEDLAAQCDFTKYYCGSTLAQPSGTIVSPIYPDTLDGPVQCVWNIEGKFGEVIVLDMKQFKLGYKNDCGKANLEVRDSETDALIGSYCGSQTPRKVTSHSNRMYIKYFTDGALKGERFKIEYTREAKRSSKKTLQNQCKPSKTMNNVTLVGGAKAGNFTDLGYSTDMEDCKQRCCNMDECEIAFMLDENCYAVKCINKDLCRIRKAKSSNLNPQLAFIRREFGDRVPVPDSIDDTNKQITTGSDVCPHNPVLLNATLVGGIKAGNFTSHGLVENFNECLSHCCSLNECDAAFMVKHTCFSLQCANDRLCDTRQAKPSPYHPMVAFLNRYRPEPKNEQTGDTKALITTKPSSCKDVRVSKVYRDVTLKGGISSGDFTDKGHVTSMDECINKCCGTDTCNVAFVIKDTCFTVKCSSYDDCALKSAVSEYYSPKIAYINWNPPKDDLGETVPYSYKGCWRDFDITAFALPLLEGTDPKLMDPYKKRSDPVNDCSSVSQARGYKVFAIQNGGACFSGPLSEQTYKRYGKSEACKGGKGGPFANSVYKSFDDGSVIALGCWADLQDRAFRRMEKNDPLLSKPFDSRSDPIAICAKVAEKMKMKYFALQKGGQCFVAKQNKATYDKYSPSRKCKYGLGGQMANDVYMLKKNFTETAENIDHLNTNASLLTAFKNEDIEDGETVYKEEIAGKEYVKYVYKADTPIDNVTLASAINAGTFEDKGKVEKMSDCVKTCGESKDCNVAFLLSSQCFNVHCFSDDTCKIKPAFSTYYKPQLAFIKHRVIRKARNTTQPTATAPIKNTCTPISEAQNMTFINGINSGNFSDMGQVDNMEDCKARCCQDKKCNIAFKIQSDCYGVRCYSKDSCRTRLAKNSNLFMPMLTMLRPIEDAADEALQQKSDASKATPSVAVSTATLANAPSSPASKVPTFTGVSRSPTPSKEPVNQCSDDAWDKSIITNETLIGGINAGDFRDHGQADTMTECMGYCCNEKDCDLSFMIDKDCYTVRCYSPSLCKTRIAKPTTFIPQIAFKKSSKFVIDKSNLSELLLLRGKPTPENETAELAYAAFKSVLLALPDAYNATSVNNNKTKNNSQIYLDHFPELFKSFLNGISDAIDFVQDTVTELTTDKDGLEKPFNILYRGLSTTTPTIPTHQPTLQISSTYKTHTVIPKPQSSTTPSSSSVSLQPSAQATPSFGDPQNHSCKAEPIIYNATLRLGMHSGLFTKLGRVKAMDDCIERCCRSSNADVAYMLGPFCFAVKCKTKEMCKPSPAMYSDITSLNLNPAISFLNKDSVPSISQENDKDILDSVFDQTVDTDDLIQHVIKNLTASQKLRQNKATNFKKKLISNDTLTHITTKPITNDSLTTTTTTTTNANVTTTTETATNKTATNQKAHSKSKIVMSTGFGRDLTTSGATNDGMCADSPITYNVTLRGGVHSGKFTELGEGIPMRDCVGKCCDTPLCDVAFMFSDKCYAVGCYDEAQCQAVIAKPSKLSPKLAYVTKFRNNPALSLDDMPSGIGFSLNSESKCSTKNVKHGPIFTNKTLIGGMKAGNFTFLGHVKDINSCLSKCCASDKCEMAYLVNQQQCYGLKCYTPELCQIDDAQKPITTRLIQISKVMKPNKRRKLKTTTMFAYLAIGLVTMTICLTGFVWAALFFVRRNNSNGHAKSQQTDNDPKPDR